MELQCDDERKDGPEEELPLKIWPIADCFSSICDLINYRLLERMNQRI